VLESAASPEVEVIEGARAHADERLAARDVRLGRIFVAKDLRSAMLMKTNGFHECGQSIKRL
jgi:hypothetical protein